MTVEVRKTKTIIYCALCFSLGLWLRASVQCLCTCCYSAMSDAHEHYASSFYGLDFAVPDFRAQVAGVASSIRSESGFPAFVLEFAYLKYLHNEGVRVHHQYHKITRFNVWVSARYLKHYSRQGRFWTFAPLHMPMRDTRVRRLIAATLSLLNAHMQEISRSSSVTT